MGVVRKKLLFSVVLILTAALFSNAVMAAAAHWAEEPVNKLNSIYGPGTFSTAYDQPVTAGVIKGLLSNTFKYSDLSGYIGIDGVSDNAAVTRGVLAHTLAKLFKLGEIAGDDDASRIDAAIDICRSKGIMSGYSPGEFGKDDIVNRGELAVGFCRAVNKAAGGTMTNKWGLIPGALGYNELLYFLVRSIPFGENVYTATLGENAQSVWDAWRQKLLYPIDADPVVQLGTEYAGSGLTADSTTVSAVVKAVELFRHELKAANVSTDVFYDVSSGSWYYDGIMYLLNQNIVKGNGKGYFLPYNQVTRAEMAALVLRAEGIDFENLGTPDMAEFIQVFTHPNFLDEDGNLNWTAKIVWAAKDYYGLQTGFDPDSLLTRQEMAYAAVMLYQDYDPDYVNLAVLDRFADKNEIGEEYKKPLAYLVTVGVLDGSPEEGGLYLHPTNVCNRAEAGVFMARVLQGLDKSKMKDYKNAVDYVLSGGAGQ